MRITTAYELLVFPVRQGDDTSMTIEPGTYDVEEVTGRDGERWWKLSGQDWGNAICFWKAVQRPADTLRNRLETLAKQVVLLVSAALLAFAFIKTDWAYVTQAPALPAFHNRATCLLSQYTQGGVFSAHELPSGEVLVSRYACGWRIMQEVFSGVNRQLQSNHVVQVHKELLLSLMLVTAFFPSSRMTMLALKLLLPVLLVGQLGTPRIDPMLDPPLVFYYLILAAAVAALIWNNYTYTDEKPPFLYSLLSLLAWVYNGIILLIILVPKLGWA